MFGTLPDWLQLLLAVLVGAGTAVLVAGKFGWFSRDRTAVIEAAIQRLEAKIDLEITTMRALIDTKIESDRHQHLWPTLQVRVMQPLDKVEDRVGRLEQDMAVIKHHLAIAPIPNPLTRPSPPS